ncbi:universal stress protein [bacterium]|nr:universal stress protein [bacterium]
MQILLATDGSSHSEMAARTLIALGPPLDTEMVVVYIMEPPLYLITPVVPPPYNVEWHRVEHEMRVEAEEEASRAVEQVERILSTAGASSRSIIDEGFAADEIIRIADEIGAELVVVGSKGLTGSQLFLLGSVSQKVIRYAPCSVLLTKPARDADTSKIAKIILATDGSENAIEAARFLSSFHLQHDVEVVVLHVVHRESRWIPRSSSAQHTLEQVRSARLEHAEQLVQETKNGLSTEATVTTAVREGDPAEQILKTSAEMEADLIVVGSKGLGGIQMFLLGSVSQKVCRYSDRSVMLVRMQQRSIPGTEG